MMKRWQVVAFYCVFGPLLGGLLVAAYVLIGLRPSADFLVELVATSLVFAFPVGGLAAMSAGLAHAMLFRRIGPCWLVLAVSAVGLAAHIGSTFFIGNLRGLLDSAESFLAFAAPPVASSVVLSCFLVWRSRDASSPSSVPDNNHRGLE